MTERHFYKPDTKDLLLLYLGDILDSEKDDDKDIVPLEEISDVKEEDIKGALSDLEGGEKIIEEESSEDQAKKGRYNLTEEGKKESEKIWDDLKEEHIILIDDKDAIRLRFKNVLKVLDDTPLIKLIKDIDDRGVLDLREDGKSRDELVDREEHIKQLKDLITEVEDEEIRTMFISGDTGIGKTRLVEELKNMVLEKDFDFLEGRCLIEDQAPYAPLKRALSKFLDIERGMSKAQSVITPSQSSKGKAQNQKMFDVQRNSVFYGTTKFLKSLSEFRPLVIFFDDLQWADSGTLNILEYMAEKLKDEAVILIGAYRPEAVSESDPLKKTMRRMSRKKLYEEVELEPFEGKSIKKMVSEITGIEEIPERFIKNLKEKTNGNPLFLRESINQMVKEGSIKVEKGEFVIEGETFRIPDVVQNVIEKRVFDLDDETREILQLGSVIGKDIPFELLADASDKDKLELLDNIDPLLENNIWEEDPRENTFSFSHNLLVDTIYNGIGKWVERKNLHLKIAKAVETIYKENIDERYFTLGHHFKNGGNHKKAFIYFIRAAEKAEKVYAHEDAIDRYEEALVIANRTDKIEREKMISLLEELGEINNIIGNYEKSRKYLDQALMKVKDPERRMKIYKNIAKSWINQGEFNKVIKITEEALNLMDTDEGVPDKDEFEESVSLEKENTPVICNLLSKKGWALLSKGKYQQAKEIFFEELNRAKELRDRSILAQAYHDLGSLERGGLCTEDCIQYLDKAIEIRKDILDEEDTFKEKHNLFRSYNNLGAIYFELRDLDRSLSLFERAFEINKEIKNKMFKAIALNNIALIQTKKGELEKSEDILKEVLEIAEGIHYKQGLFLGENIMGVIHMERGEFDPALEHFEKSEKIAEGIDFKLGMIDNYEEISKIHTFKGELEEASDCIGQAHQLAEEIKNERSIGKTLRLNGKIKRLKGDIEEGLEDHKKAIEINNKHSRKANLFWNKCELVEDHLAKDDLEKAWKNLKKAKEENIGTKESDLKLKMLKGMLLREKGKIEESEDLLEKSLQKSKELSKKYMLAKVKYELGKLQLAMDNDESAKGYLDDSKQLFEEMGMKLRLKEAKESLESLD